MSSELFSDRYPLSAFRLAEPGSARCRSGGVLHMERGRVDLLRHVGSRDRKQGEGATQEVWPDHQAFEPCQWQALRRSVLRLRREQVCHPVDHRRRVAAVCIGKTHIRRQNPHIYPRPYGLCVCARSNFSRGICAGAISAQRRDLWAKAVP
jgi:hypothetical protein